MHPIDHIKSFARMTPELEATLRSLMKEQSFRKGDTIRGAINLTNYSYYIKHGAARVYVTNGGKEHTLSFSFDDEFIIATQQSIKDDPDTIAIQFLEPTEIIYLPHLKVKDILTDSTTVETTSSLLFLNAALIRYTNFLEERLHIMQTYNATQRYQWVIKRHPRILETAPATQIASYLGLTKETLYRIRNNKY
ncbi:MAG: Crp/Fnr family transcriptional regulator [Muribaculaceae bacterium]|nr:Crp/Fnr family transcriptional regulator [Muribaculaceae bacterium]